jgi:hypothetical protein
MVPWNFMIWRIGYGSSIARGQWRGLDSDIKEGGGNEGRWRKEERGTIT